MDNNFFLSTQQTAFSMRLIKNFDTELLIGQISYNQKANIYNAIHGYNERLMKTRSAEKGDTEPEIFIVERDHGRDKRDSQSKTAEDILKEREHLDRRRFEHAHLQYALLQVVYLFSQSFNLREISFRDFNETIKNLAPAIHEAFTSHYTGIMANTRIRFDSNSITNLLAVLPGLQLKSD
ncbi:hypothetical protein OS493_007114 [Desmophyllum pertusum]|uniref:Uncharacterized protein n=1 Tax=Desmophyllum pertusum TaxID=174260 RepID=A0A9X0CZ18_9CNID|nr:hypothetical protein OS493_007114 [Desmophyllum pertusum]